MTSNVKDCACDPARGYQLALPPMSNQDWDLSRWIRLIQSEYFEMPGLHLTRQQMQRLWGLDHTVCEMVLKTLESSRFLRRTPSDAYVRADVSV